MFLLFTRGLAFGSKPNNVNNKANDDQLLNTLRPLTKLEILDFFKKREIICEGIRKDHKAKAPRVTKLMIKLYNKHGIIAKNLLKVYMICLWHYI